MQDASQSSVNGLQNPSSTMRTSVRLALLLTLAASCSTQEACYSEYQFTLGPPVYGFQCNPYSVAEMRTLCAISSTNAELQIDWHFQPNGANDVIKISSSSKHVLTEQWEGVVLTARLAVLELNASVDAGVYTCTASVNGAVLTPNRSITLRSNLWYADLMNCSSFAKEPCDQFLCAQPQPVSTPSDILAPIPTPSGSDTSLLPSQIHTANGSSHLPPSDFSLFPSLTPLDFSQSPSQTPTTNSDLSLSPSQTPTTNSDFSPSLSQTPTSTSDFSQSPSQTPTTNSDFSLSPSQTPTTNSNLTQSPSQVPTSSSSKPMLHHLSSLSSTIQPSSLQTIEAKIGLTEWLYISIALLLLILVAMISTLMSVIIFLLVRRNSVGTVVTADTRFEIRSVTRKPSDPLPPLSAHESKFHTGAASFSGRAGLGAEPGVRAAWISPSKMGTPAKRSGHSHQVSSLGNVAVGFVPPSLSCASIYAEVGPPQSSAYPAASQLASLSSSAHGPCLRDPKSGTGVGNSLVQLHHPSEHQYDTPEAVIHTTLNGCVLPEEMHVPSPASCWHARSGGILGEPPCRCRTGVHSDTVASVATGDSWFGRWSPIFISQQQQRRRTTRDSANDDILSLTVRPSSLTSNPSFISPECALADDRKLERDRLASSTKHRLDSCSTFHSEGGVMEGLGVIRYLQPSATALSSELSLMMFDDDDSPLPVSCESRPSSSSTSDLCEEAMTGHIMEARHKSATAPTASSRSPSSSSGYTDMSKYSGDYERDPLYMAVQRMRASRAQDQKEDNKRDTGVFSEADDLYSPLSCTRPGDALDPVGASGYQSLNSTTIILSPTYMKPLRLSSQETCV